MRDLAQSNFYIAIFIMTSKHEVGAVVHRALVNGFYAMKQLHLIIMLQAACVKGPRAGVFSDLIPFLPRAPRRVWRPNILTRAGICWLRLSEHSV